MVDTKAVSVRLPLDLLNKLNTYATDKGMVRSGDANIGGAIIAVLREHFGESDNVKQVSDNVDIKALIETAINSRLIIIESEVSGLRTDRHIEKTDRLLIEKLQTDLAIAHNRIDDLDKKIAALSSEATAPEKKSVRQMKVIAA